MVTIKQMTEWYPEILADFQKVMPAVARPLPEIVIGTKATWAKKRAAVVEKLRSNQIKPDGMGGLETIHGEKGDVIFVYQHTFGNHINCYSDFRHSIWHELGHFYAICNQDPTFIRFIDQKPHPDEYEALRGYYFWSEFIAEKTACDLEPELEIDWSSADFRVARNHLAKLLLDGTKMINDMIDWYWLSFYFARIISDKVILGYLTAAKNGTLTYQRSFTDKTIPLCESDIDPLCLDLVEKPLGLILRGMKKIIDEQLARDNPYNVSLDVLSNLGEGLILIERHHKGKEFAERLRLQKQE